MSFDFRNRNVVKLICVGLFYCFLFSSCKKENSVTAVETGTVVDFDNNSYKTIKIGDQWWMAENLKVMHYRTGAIIQNSTSADSLTWATTTSGAYCQYDGNYLAPGFLYNFYAIADSNNLAPLGWHIPTDTDWKKLEKALGMSDAECDKFAWRGSNEADKLKMTGVAAWSQFQSLWATNESGFSALAGGCRLFNSLWSDPLGISYSGFWWTSTLNSNGDGFYRYLDYKSTKVFRSHVDKHYGFSVRCVKD